MIELSTVTCIYRAVANKAICCSKEDLNNNIQWKKTSFDNDMSVFWRKSKIKMEIAVIANKISRNYQNYLEIEIFDKKILYMAIMAKIYFSLYR